MGKYDYRPVIQIFDIDTEEVVTVPGLFEKDARILQMRKDPELNVFDVVMTRRDAFKINSFHIDLRHRWQQA